MSVLEQVALNEVEVRGIEIFRTALSEESIGLRKRAIENFRHETVSERLKKLVETVPHARLKACTNSLFMQWFTETSSHRTDAAFEFAETTRRYDDKNEKKLNIAEEIGVYIFVFIKDYKFKGIHTKGGIFEHVRADAIKEGVHGAKDKDVLRKY